MKKKLLLILVLISSLLVIGCNKVTEDNLLVKGQEKLESYQYDEALSLLSQVLDSDPQNDAARDMYMQARKMQNAKKYEENHDYKKAIKELDAIVNINNGSKKIKRESINKKAELEKLQQNAEKEELKRKENAKESSKKDINKLESEIIYNNKKEELKKEELKQEEIKQEELNEDKVEEDNKQEQMNQEPTEDNPNEDTQMDI